jgi:hypothetical protein
MGQCQICYVETKTLLVLQIIAVVLTINVMGLQIKAFYNQRKASTLAAI